MKSRFSIRAYIMFIPINLVFGFLFFAALVFFIQEPSDFIPLVLFSFMFLLVFWGEFRLKCTVLASNKTELSIRRFGGLGRKRIYAYKQLTGFRISEVGSFEHLYFIAHGQRVGEISAAYHKNYLEMKGLIAKNLKNLGNEDYKYLNGFKEIFLK